MSSKTGKQIRHIQRKNESSVIEIVAATNITNPMLEMDMYCEQPDGRLALDRKLDIIKREFFPGLEIKFTKYSKKRAQSYSVQFGLDELDMLRQFLDTVAPHVRNLRGEVFDMTHEPPLKLEPLRPLS